jgi:hypothetical protein
MAVGLSNTKQQTDDTGGKIARDLNVAFERIADFTYWLDGVGSTGLVALGYTEAEAATMLSAFADLDELRAVYQGALDLPTAKDFRQFARRIWGFGLEM